MVFEKTEFKNGIASASIFLSGALAIDRGFKARLIIVVVEITTDTLG